MLLTKNLNFYEWLKKQSPPLWWAEKNLVRERVSHFIDENGKPNPAEGFQSNWAWSGDQGLMLGALVDRIRLMVANTLRLLRWGAVGFIDWLGDECFS